DVEASAIVEHAVVMVRNAPWTGIEIESGGEFASLRAATELGVAVAAAQRPATAAGAVVVFEHLDAVACLAQFERRDQSGEAGTQDEHGRPLGIAIEPDRPRISGFCSKTQTRHGAVHCRPAGRGSDERKEIASAHLRFIALAHLCLLERFGRSRASCTNG